MKSILVSNEVSWLCIAFILKSICNMLKSILSKTFSSSLHGLLYELKELESALISFFRSSKSNLSIDYDNLDFGFTSSYILLVFD